MSAMQHIIAPALACLVASPRASTRYNELFAPSRGRAPPLFLAPMEGLGDRAFRRALALSFGEHNVDEACTEFIRIPGVLPPSEGQVHKSAARLTRAAYSSTELGSTPLAAQIMGSDPAFLAAATSHLAGSLGAHRVDLNCGCPANTVTGRGAGSSLLRIPAALHACVEAMVRAAEPHGAVVSVKLRAGYDDTSLFEDNLRAAIDAGASLLTLHPRTRKQGYSGAADWGLTERAVRFVAPVHVIGNGDVTTVAKAKLLHSMTNCAGVMIGRGAAQDPLIFWRIKAAYGAAPEIAAHTEAALVETFLRRYHDELALAPEPRSVKAAGGRTSEELSRFRTGKLKQLANYLLRANADMQRELKGVLHTPPETSCDALLEQIVDSVRNHWHGPPSEAGLVDTFSSRNQYQERAPVERVQCCEPVLV